MHRQERFLERLLCFAEQLVGERCSEKADLYSFGVVLWELCTLDTPMLRQTRDLEYAPVPLSDSYT